MISEFESHDHHKNFLVKFIEGYAHEDIQEEWLRPMPPETRHDTTSVENLPCTVKQSKSPTGPAMTREKAEAIIRSWSLRRKL